ncbi:MAG TPA: HlyD family efflux transporter periplasmic adaptor subunit [Saprospiraceae bacterium]|nr:HlyD family efflux transporter periplasmic adaptor subunit [Saprospiraceae bacterium]HMQ82371.1 HlyD family efflux transporter periplasmic adaptor subunit [Saprospiraceae bacterium]
MNKTLRRVGVFLGFLVLFGSFAASRFLSQQKEPPKRKPISNESPAVDTLHVWNRQISTTLEVQGVLTAFDKIELFAEVSGVLKSTSQPFKVGSFFSKNALLISIEEEEAKLSLLAQKSSLLNAITQMMPDLKIDYPESFGQWQAYLNAFDPEKSITAFPNPVNQQEKYFIASRNLYNQYYTIKSVEERLSKYKIYAPFSGVITQSSINQGAVVRAGQKLGELMNTANYELETTVALRDLKYITVGQSVALFSEDIDGQWQGKVKRISDQVDGNTQTVKVFIGASGNGLREGMYLRGMLAASSIENAVELPRELLIDQKAVYVLQDSSLALKTIQVLKITESAAIVRGLENGTPILKTLVSGLFDGIKVRVANTASSSSSTPALSE